MKLFSSLSMIAVLALCAAAQAQAPAATLPNAPQQPAAPQQGQGPSATAAGQTLPPAITIEQAIELAKRNNPTLNANQTLISQSRAQEITANLRPNPLLSWDLQYLPIFQPSLFGDSNYWEPRRSTTSGWDICSSAGTSGSVDCRRRKT